MKILNLLCAILYAAAFLSGILYLTLQHTLFSVLLLVCGIAASVLLLVLSLLRLKRQKGQKR